MDEHSSSFVWDLGKEAINIAKHGVDFDTAIQAFRDPKRNISIDLKHSGPELRYYCIGRVGQRILTVRFVYRGETIRIIGAGYWRKGAQLYDQSKKKESG